MNPGQLPNGAFRALCPNCKEPMVMKSYPSMFPGNEWVGRCPNDHYIQLRASKIGPPEEGDQDFDQPAISIKKSKLGRRR